MKKIFLDASHGGKDSGGQGNGLKEKEIVLSVTIKIGNILKRHGVEVEYSRTIDVFVDLQKRAEMANEFGADAFVSIHTNAFSNSAAKGIEVYSYPTSKEGAELSREIYDSIINDKVYTQKRGTKTANFSVLRNTKMPAALVELGFITNINDASILKNGKNELATAVAKGILEYLGIKYVEDEQEVDSPKDKEDRLYRVQVGAFRNRENAEKLVEELKNKGYNAIIV